jgi:hypothetical protein
MNNNISTEGQQRQFFDTTGGSTGSFNFDSWAVAVRRQMLASLKKREAGRSTWT